MQAVPEHREVGFDDDYGRKLHAWSSPFLVQNQPFLAERANIRD
jgi:hypothetical protein